MTSTGALNHASFTTLPSLIPPGSSSSVTEGTEWANGESRLVKDNHGSGEILGFRWSESSPTNVYLIASENNGQTWRMAANNPSSKCGSCSLFPNKIMSVTQDSSGTLHALMAANDYGINGGNSFREYYVRMTLSYDTSSKVSGFQVTAVVALPDHHRTVTTREDLRGNIKVIDFAGQESLMYILNVSTISQSPRDIKVFVGRATSLTPTATSNFVGINGAAGDTKILDSCIVGGSSYCSVTPAYFSTHNVSADFGQNRSTKDIYVIEGPIEADFAQINDPAQPEMQKIRYYRLAWNSSNSTWAASGPFTIVNASSTSLPSMLNVQSGSTAAWLMYLHPTNGIVFGRLDANGYTNVTNPLAVADHNGWGVFTISPDESKIWTIWHISARGGSPVTSINPKTAQAYWNGSTWSGTTFTDTGITDGNNSGLVGISGWNSGVATMLFQGQLIAPVAHPTPKGASIWSN